MTISERQAWISTFSGDDGRAVLAAILNELGYFSDDPSLIHPAKIATANWILRQMGILTLDNIGPYTDALVSSASINDLRDKGDE